MDEQTHYRYYDIKQNACLDMIQYMKELGMELKKNKQVIQKNEENTEVKTGCFPHFLISLENCISQQIKVSGSKIPILDGYLG